MFTIVMARLVVEMFASMEEVAFYHLVVSLYTYKPLWKVVDPRPPRSGLENSVAH